MHPNQKQFDVAVLGGGPGGYPAAIKAAQMGKKVALIEAGELGGTCLNRGCISSKTLISCAEELHRIKRAQEYGIHIDGYSFDFSQMVQRKDQIVDRVRRGLQGLIASNRITLFKGFGKLTGPQQIKISGETSQEIQAQKIILATGSEPREMSAFPFDRIRIHDSTSLLNHSELPKSLVIIGGGIIGCEFASLYREFGVDITILEALDRLIPMECQSVSTALQRAFVKRGVNIDTTVFVEKILNTGKEVVVTLAGGREIHAEMALVATGRQLNTSKIGLENVGVVIQESGIIEVNEKMETSVPGIYAVGDIASKWWLAHVASHQGLVAATNACGGSMKMHYNAVPSVIFTSPEIATVGYSLDAALRQGFHATLGSFPFQALGRSQATLQTEGFAQVILDRKTGQILGAQVVGYQASTLIAEMTIAIANEMTIESITQTIHAHPTVAEVWLEAALVAAEEPLHLPPKKTEK